MKSPHLCAHVNEVNKSHARCNSVFQGRPRTTFWTKTGAWCTRRWGSPFHWRWGNSFSISSKNLPRLCLSTKYSMTWNKQDYHSGDGENWILLGFDGCVDGKEFLTFRRKLVSSFPESSILLGLLTLQTKPLVSFETSFNVYQSTRRHIDEEIYIKVIV